MDSEAPVSKTQKKRQDKELRKLGEALVSMSKVQLERIDMPETLLAEVNLARSIKSHGARRRQILHIGALIRAVDHEPIRHAVEEIRLGDMEKNLAFKKVERWRDELKEGNTALIEEILGECPAAERQRLTQLARNARTRAGTEGAVKSSRALFRYLREISES